ncbi:hypothetical protein OG21DRAFT_1516424 [Imleria badia]|nr:hypothetical protein OG21DRAFT_1516424 [Imleria badia]
MPAGTATCSTALVSSEDTGHYEQPVHFNYQCPPHTQPETASVQDQQQGQHEVQVSQEDFAVTAKEPSQEPGEVYKEGYHTQQESHDALAELLHKAGHQCSNNPHTGCTGRGTICLDTLWELVAQHPDILSNEQVTRYAIASIAPESDAGQSTEGQPSQVDIHDPLPSLHGAGSGEMASSASSTTASTSTSAHASPSGSIIYPPNHLVATSSSMDSSTGKRQRSEDDPQDRLKKQRREQCTDTQGELGNHYAPYKNRTSAGGGEKRRKKKSKSADEGEYFCLLCRIFRGSHLPLSRKDALKRHISKVHKLFKLLLKNEYSDFKILDPRRTDQLGDLRPLIEFCITVQSQARENGVEIKKKHDLKHLYPDVAASMNHS